MGEYFDLHLRYPDLFEGLTVEQRHNVIDPLVSSWLDGYEHSREDVARLIDLELGRISGEEYRKQILERARAIGKQRVQEVNSSTEPGATSNVTGRYQPVDYLPERG